MTQESPRRFLGDLLLAGPAESAMLNRITTHAPTDGAHQSEEGSSGKCWFGTVNRLHCTFRPFLIGNAYQFPEFLPCSGYFFRRAEHG